MHEGYTQIHRYRRTGKKIFLFIRIQLNLIKHIYIRRKYHFDLLAAAHTKNTISLIIIIIIIVNSIRAIHTNCIQEIEQKNCIVNINQCDNI